MLNEGVIEWGPCRRVGESRVRDAGGVGGRYPGPSCQWSCSYRFTRMDLPDFLWIQELGEVLVEGPFQAGCAQRPLPDSSLSPSPPPPTPLRPCKVSRVPHLPAPRAEDSLGKFRSKQRSDIPSPGKAQPLNREPEPSNLSRVCGVLGALGELVIVAA